LKLTTAVREGDLKLKGIRSLWSDIHTTKVFSVCFDKKVKALTKKAYNAAKQSKLTMLWLISAPARYPWKMLSSSSKRTQSSKLKRARKESERLQGTIASTNGFYDVIDMDIEDPENKGANLRKVNINEIKMVGYQRNQIYRGITHTNILD